MPRRSAAFERFRFSFFDDPDLAPGSRHPGARRSRRRRARASGRDAHRLPPRQPRNHRPRRAVLGQGGAASGGALRSRALGATGLELEPDASWLPHRLLHLVTALWRIGRIRAGLLPQSTCSARRRSRSSGRRPPRRCTMFAIRPPFRRSSKLSTTRSPWCATMLRAGCLRSAVCPRIQGPAAHALPADGGRGFTARRRQAGRPRRRCRSAALVGVIGYRASGSGRSWNLTTFGRVPLPPSMWNGARVLVVAHSPLPFHPAASSSTRASIHLA